MWRENLLNSSHLRYLQEPKPFLSLASVRLYVLDQRDSEKCLHFGGPHRHRGACSDIHWCCSNVRGSLEISNYFSLVLLLELFFSWIPKCLSTAKMDSALTAQWQASINWCLWYWFDAPFRNHGTLEIQNHSWCRDHSYFDVFFHCDLLKAACSRLIWYFHLVWHQSYYIYFKT